MTLIFRLNILVNTERYLRGACNAGIRHGASGFDALLDAAHHTSGEERAERPNVLLLRPHLHEVECSIEVEQGCAR